MTPKLRFALWVAGIAVAVVFISTLLYYATLPSGTSTVQGGTAIDTALFVAVLVALVGAFYVVGLKKVGSLIGTALLLFFVIDLYRKGILTSGFHRREMLYVLAIALAAILTSVLITNREKFAGTAMILAIFTLLGFSHFLTWEELVNWRWNSAHRQQSVSVNQTARVHTTNRRCSSQPETKMFGPGITPINSSHCQLRGYVIDGCGYWYDGRGRKLAYSCKGPMPSIDGIVAFGANGVAVVRINHCEPWTPGNRVDTCS